MGRFALFAIVAAVAGCAAPKKPTVVRPQVPKPAAIAPVETLPPLSACLYYVDDGTGEVRRISLDGRIREIVLAPGSRNSLSQLQIEAPSRYLVSGLTIGGIPRDGAGYTLLEPFPPQLTRKMLNCIPYVDIGSSETVRAGIGFNDRPSRWKIRRHWGSVQAGDHSHEAVVSIELEDGSRRREMDFGNPEWAGLLYVADERHAVIYDRPNVYIWDLESDVRTCIAHTSSKPIVWPRDMRQPERFVPIASTAFNRRIYRWRVRNPHDVETKPEYLKPERLRRTGT